MFRLSFASRGATRHVLNPLNSFFLKILPLVFIVLLTFLLTSPLWQQAGVPNTADAHHHLPRSAAVQRAFEQGVYWPRWFPESHYGRGEPTFHYYSPGLYWLVGGGTLDWIELRSGLDPGGDSGIYLVRPGGIRMASPYIQQESKPRQHGDLSRNAPHLFAYVP